MKIGNVYTTSACGQFRPRVVMGRGRCSGGRHTKTDREDRGYAG